MDVQHYWEYFLAIEDDLMRTSRFVEFAPVSPEINNDKTYSIEFAQIILASASEFDVIAKMLCKEISPQEKVKDIDDYCDVITGHYEKFTTMEVPLPRYKRSLIPWADWKRDQSPNWWRSYNGVKHSRDKHYSKANLETALNSVAGLLCGLLYLFRKTEGKDIRLKPGTQLFMSTNNTMLCNGTFCWCFSFPDD